MEQFEYYFNMAMTILGYSVFFGFGIILSNKVRIWCEGKRIEMQKKQDEHLKKQLELLQSIRNKRQNK